MIESSSRASPSVRWGARVFSGGYMNNFIFICEEDFKNIIKEAVILATLFGNNNNDRKDNNNNGVHESKEN